MSKKPGKRRAAREAAVQFLFCRELNELDSGPAEKAFWELRPLQVPLRIFANELIEGTTANLTEIDARLAAVVENYQPERIDKVDRCILRLAVFEMLFREDIPVPVSINEAIELARRFGTSDSPGFVNGVLDRIHKLANH